MTNKTYEAWVMMDNNCCVITDEYATAQGALDENLRKYTIDEMHDNGFTLNKVLVENGCWVECLDEIDY